MGYSGKLELETLGKLLLLVAFLIVVIIVFIGVKDSMDEGHGGFRDYVCWGSNLIKHNVLNSFPSGCSEGKARVTYIKGETNEERYHQVAEMIDKCWWMYGEGEWDMGSKGDYAITTMLKNLIPGFGALDYTYNCYSFSVDEDAGLGDVFNYMQTHERGYSANAKEVGKGDKNSYWNHIQDNSLGKGIGVDKNIDEKLTKDKTYYIIFYDERHFESIKGSFVFQDRVLISNDKDFGDDIWEKIKKIEDIKGKLDEFVLNRIEKADKFLSKVDRTLENVGEGGCRLNNKEECYNSNVCVPFFEYKKRGDSISEERFFYSCEPCALNNAKAKCEWFSKEFCEMVGDSRKVCDKTLSCEWDGKMCRTKKDEK